MRKKKKSFEHIKRRCHLNIDDTTVSLPLVCSICNTQCKSISGFGTHLLNKHGITIEQYVFQLFENATPEFEFEKCAFCNKHEAKPILIVDFKKRRYKLSYDRGYQCDELDCINDICQQFFGKQYADVLQAYAKLGSNTKFLAIRYRCTEDYVKMNIKHNPDYVIPKESTTSLEGFIARHGKKKGTRLYNQRRKKIARSLTIEWFIEKYGLEEGSKKFQERFNNFISASKDIIHSKNQCAIFESLKQIDPSWQDERYAGGIAKVDMLNEKNNVVVEYFGDYWHCNPDTYDDDFFNKNLKCTAKEKQHRDKERLDKILAYSKSIELIIVIWEKSFHKINDVTKITDLVYNHIRKHKQGKKEIIWI